jgi:hypothetical protein
MRGFEEVAATRIGGAPWRHPTPLSVAAWAFFGSGTELGWSNGLLAGDALDRDPPSAEDPADAFDGPPSAEAEALVDAVDRALAAIGGPRFWAAALHASDLAVVLSSPGFRLPERIAREDAWNALGAARTLSLLSGFIACPAFTDQAYALRSLDAAAKLAAIALAERPDAKGIERFLRRLAEPFPVASSGGVTEMVFAEERPVSS